MPETGNPYDVLCIGQAVIDCITRGQEPDRHRENVFRAEKIELHIGGDSVNESIALTQLGHRAAIACGVGRDLGGSILCAELKRQGVNTDNISVMDVLTTPIAQLVVHQDGGRHSINSRATMLEGYTPFADQGQDLPSARRMQSAMSKARIVSFASLFRAPLDREEVVRSLVKAAKEAGAVVSADTKLPTFREIPPRAMADIWPLIDYIFPNEKEAAYYTEETDFSKMAETFRRFGVHNVVIKAGADGCYVNGRDGAFHLPALPVEVVDSTGAGDNFVAGFLSGVLRGEDLMACAVRGRARASHCISRMGAGGD